MAKGITSGDSTITESDLLAELASYYGRPAMEETDITTSRICAKIRADGGRASETVIERDMIARAAAGEFRIVVKRGQNGRDVNCYVKA